MKLKSFTVLGAVGMMMMTGYSRAEVTLTCNTEAECQSKEAAIQAQIEKLNAELAQVRASKSAVSSAKSAGIESALRSEVTLGDIEKHPDGSVRHMNQYNAEKYCTAQGSRLPTAKELAKEAQDKFNAKGIRETNHAGISVDDEKVKAEYDQMNRDGYSPVWTKDKDDKTVVDFYFNHSGYQRPAGDLGSHFFWTSSVHPGVFSIFAYGLDGGNGVIYYDFFRRYGYRTVSAVRCVSSR